MIPHQGVCHVCHRGGTLNCTGVCRNCRTSRARVPKESTWDKDGVFHLLARRNHLAMRAEQWMENARRVYRNHKRAAVYIAKAGRARQLCQRINDRLEVLLDQEAKRDAEWLRVVSESIRDD